MRVKVHMWVPVPRPPAPSMEDLRESCIPCRIAEDLCELLPEGKREVCREVAEQIRLGRMNGVEARMKLMRVVGLKDLTRATEQAVRNVQESLGILPD